MRQTLGSSFGISVGALFSFIRRFDEMRVSDVCMKYNIYFGINILFPNTEI